MSQTDEPSDMHRSDAYRDVNFAQIFRAYQQYRRAKDKQERPSKTDDAPGRLIFDYAVGNQAAHTVDRQVTQTEVFQFLAKHAQN